MRFSVTNPVAIVHATTPAAHRYIDTPVGNILIEFWCHYSC